MITLEQHELRKLLIEAARIGANEAIDNLVTCNLQDAADRLGVSYSTLARRMAQGKIHAIDGRITGAEIRRYLSEARSNA